MPVATSTAILIGAGVAALGSGAQAYQANQARQQQKKGLNFQKQAQAQAEGMAMRESELAAMERKKQQAQTPDVASLLTGEQGAMGRGASSTLLGQGSGATSDNSRIGKNRLLGE